MSLDIKSIRLVMFNKIKLKLIKMNSKNIESVSNIAHTLCWMHKFREVLLTK